MAAQTRELASMTHRTRGLIEAEVFVGVGVEEIGGVIGRLELRGGFMAQGAAIGRLDAVVADQAVRHARHVRVAGLSRFAQTPVARFARVHGVQVLPDVARRRKIGAAIDRAGDDRRHVPELQVRFVAERLQRRFSAE